MIVPSAGEAVEFVVIIDKCTSQEVNGLIAAKSVIADAFGARGAIVYAGTLDVA